MLINWRAVPCCSSPRDAPPSIPAVPAGTGDVSQPDGTRPRASRDTPDTGPHAEALARVKTKTAAIRYAVAELAGAPPAEVTA
jgi:hypothetical protein